jgi:hypothetical protein
MTAQATQLASILENGLGVPQAYKHIPKRVTPGQTIEPEGTVLKWYSVYEQDLPVPDEITKLARSFLMRNPLQARGLGFVLLHRCGKDFYFLIVSTWRGSNEIWETVFYKDGDAMQDFALSPREKEHKPTFCVWELAAVWYEKQVWERFLNSVRDEGAARVWREDCYEGTA